ncbi:MAG: hypothetical protein IJY39_07125, partial [Clostridia bacterium]|nr:hypothetical protein [Clostridia bacterium]
TIFIILGGLALFNLFSFGLAFSSPFLLLLRSFPAPPVEPGVYLVAKTNRQRKQYLCRFSFHFTPKTL